MEEGPLQDTQDMMPEAQRKDVVLHCLSSLLNDTTSHANTTLAPLPTIAFRYSDVVDGLVYEGPISAAQYDRFRHLTQATDMDFDVTEPKDCADHDALRLVVHRVNAEKLHAIAEKEAVRRAQGPEVASKLSQMTGLPWEWDGMTVTTYCPDSDHQAHSVLGDLLQKKVIPENSCIATQESKTQFGDAHWLSVHDVDMTRLKLQERGQNTQLAH